MPYVPAVIYCTRSKEPSNPGTHSEVCNLGTSAHLKTAFYRGFFPSKHNIQALKPMCCVHLFLRCFLRPAFDHTHEGDGSRYWAPEGQGRGAFSILCVSTSGTQFVRRAIWKNPCGGVGETCTQLKGHQSTDFGDRIPPDTVQAHSIHPVGKCRLMAVGFPVPDLTGWC
jgi:hypothetical protein